MRLHQWPGRVRHGELALMCGAVLVATVLVIMAMVTTFMASPIFERLAGAGTHQPNTEAEFPTVRSW
jgi:hypothetical protein